MDNEALILHACMTRMDARLLSTATAGQRHKKPHFIPTADGKEFIDIAHRTDTKRPAILQPFGDGDPMSRAEEVELAVVRSDAAIAEASLIRLTQVAQDALRELAALRASRLTVDSIMKEKDDTIAALRRRVAELEAIVAEKADPAATFLNYRDAWKQQHATGQSIVKLSIQQKDDALRKFLDCRGDTVKKRLETSTSRLVFHHTEALLQREFHRDDGEIDRVLKMFGPRQLMTNEEEEGGSVAGGGSDLDNLQTPPSVAMSALSEPGAETETMEVKLQRNAQECEVEVADQTRSQREAGETAAEELLYNVQKMDAAQAQKFKLDDCNADGEVLTIASIKGAAALRARRAKGAKTQSKLKSNEIVITYFLQTKVRKVQQQNDTGSLISQLQNILLFSPTTYSVLVVDAQSFASKVELITEQAASALFGAIWKELQTFDVPTVKIRTIAGPIGGVEGLRETMRRDVSLTSLPLVYPTDSSSGGQQHSGSVMSPEQHSRLQKLNALFRRSPLVVAAAAAAADEDTRIVHNATQSSSSTNTTIDADSTIDLFFEATKNYSQKEGSIPLVICRQQPGIVSYIAHNFGRCPRGVNPRTYKPPRQSPISSGEIRCYASSMVSACKAEALVSPFVDPHTPFFMTEDSPRQSVTIAFTKVVIVPTGYSIASTHPITGGLYPRSWVMEASQDGNRWVILRTHREDESLNRFCATYYWDVQVPKITQNNRGYYQYFRLTQTGPNANGTNNFCVSSFEVYGRVMHVEPLVSESSYFLPRTRLTKQGFKSFSPLPPPVEPKAAAKKKK